MNPRRDKSNYNSLNIIHIDKVNILRILINSLRILNRNTLLVHLTTLQLSLPEIQLIKVYDLEEVL